jgi:hypothetical protein
MVFPLVLVAAFSLSQTSPTFTQPKVAVIPVTSELGKVLDRHVRAALEGANVPIKPLSRLEEERAAGCENNRLCFGLLGQTVGTFAITRVELALVGTDVAVLVEAIESGSGRLIREDSFVVPQSRLDAELPGRLEPMAAKIASVLPAPRQIVLSDARPDASTDNPALNLSEGGPKRSSFPVWLTGTGAVVFAGGAAGLLAMSTTARNCLHGAPIDGMPTVCVPQSQVAVVQRRADIGLVTGVTAGAIAVGLTITAIVQHMMSN